MTRHSYSSVFNQGEDIIEIKIMDPSGNKIDTRRCKVSEKHSLLKMLRWVKAKYNVAIDDDWLSTDSEFLKF